MLLDLLYCSTCSDPISFQIHEMVNAFSTEEAMVVAPSLIGSILAVDAESDEELAREFAAEIEIGDREFDEQDPYKLGP